jgi:serine/threonine protein kinase
MLMDYMAHGELMNVLKEYKRMPASLVRFYLG